MRFFLGVNKYATIHTLYGDLGWIMPRYRRWISMIQRWNHFVQMSNSRMAKQIFLWDKDLCTDNWSAEIREICEEFGLEHEYNNLKLINIVTFKEFMLKKTTRTWYDTILFKPKLRTYREFKTISPDDYVMKYVSRRQRAMFAQFRAGILPLHIETGR